MKKDEIISIIHSSVVNSLSCRVYFKDINRSPVFGRFVVLADANEMLSKGFYRFVIADNLDDFIYSNLGYAWSKLYAISSIEYIKMY